MLTSIDLAKRSSKIITLSTSLIFTIACSNDGKPSDSIDKGTQKKPVSKIIDPAENDTINDPEDLYRNSRPLPMPTVDTPGTHENNRQKRNNKDTKSSPAQPPENDKD